MNGYGHSLTLFLLSSSTLAVMTNWTTLAGLVGALFAVIAAGIFAARRPCESLSFEDLRARCLEGYEDAHREFIRRFDPLFWRVVRAYLPDRPIEDQEEVVANTHLACLNRETTILARYQPIEGVRPEAFLRRQVIYQAMVFRRALRAQKRRQEVLMAPDSNGQSPLDSVADSGNTAEEVLLEQSGYESLLQRFQQSLSPSMLLTFELVFVRELPLQSAAESLGCSVGTLHTRIHRLRESLKSVLDLGESVEL